MAQETADCRLPTSENYLHINNIKAHFSNGGDFWHDKSQGWYSPGYNVGFNEHGAKVSTIFSSSLWLGGLDESGGALKVAALTYRQSGVDFWPGPINDKTQSTNLTQCNNYDRHWKVNRVTENIEIYTVAGQLILQKNINDNFVDVKGLSKALYYMRLVSEDGKIYQTKFIKK